MIIPTNIKKEPKEYIRKTIGSKILFFCEPQYQLIRNRYQNCFKKQIKKEISDVVKQFISKNSIKNKIWIFLLNIFNIPWSHTTIIVNKLLERGKLQKDYLTYKTRKSERRRSKMLKRHLPQNSNIHSIFKNTKEQ